MEPQDRVRWVYSSRDNEELAERYERWATAYDEDLREVFGYTMPRNAAEVFERHVPLGARILDAGAGTGLVGEALHGLGYGDLVAMDLSEGMLNEARTKGVYREFHQMVMGEPLGFPTAAFDAVICVGVLTLGHAPPGSLDELIRVTRPDGHVVFSLWPEVYENRGFREKQEALVSADKWRLAEVTEARQALPKGEPDVCHQVWVYTITGR